MSIKKSNIGMLLLATLFIFMVLVSSVGAQENILANSKPSELQQGLIDALNSKAKDLSTDQVISNYCKANKDQISKKVLSNSDAVSSTSNSMIYELKDGSKIAFTDGSHFSIISVKEEANNKALTQNAAVAASTSRTGTITASKTLYSWFGYKAYTLYTQGYFTYNGQTVNAHYINSWYVRAYATYWQVSNWEKGGYDYIPHTRSDIYGRGNFEWGMFINGYGVAIHEFYDKIYIKCDQNGKYQCLFSETKIS